MANEQLLVTLGVQDKGATTQIKALNNELKSLDKQYNASSKAGDGFDKSIEGLTKKMDLLQQKTEAQTTKLNVYKNRYDQVKKTIEEKTVALEKLKAEQGNNTKAINDAEKQLNAYQTQLKKAENGIKETEAELELLTEEVKETQNSLDNFSANKINEQFEKSKQNIENLSGKLENVKGVLNGVGNSLIALSAPIVAFSGYAVKAGVDFEKSMANAGALAGVTGEEFNKLSNNAKQLGMEIAGASAKQVADSFGYLALAGYDVNQMLTTIEPTVKASIAFNADMSTTADLLTDSLSALGLGANDASRYLDLVAQVQRKSNTSATQLMEAYIECGGSLSKMNVPLNESAKILAVMADNGLKGSEAGRSLSSVLINLMGTTSTTEKALKDLGVKVYDDEGKFRGLEVVLGEVITSASKMTDEMSDMALASLGGKTQITALNNMLKSTNSSYDDLEKSIANSNGALEEMYTIMSNTTSGKIETFKGTLESLGLQIADNLLPHLNDILEKGIELINWFSSLDESTKKSIINIGLFSAATGGALKILGGFTGGIKSVLDTAKNFTVIGNMTKSVSSLGTAGATASGTVGTLGTVLKGITLASVPVVASLAVLAGGIYTYNEYQKSMNASVSKAKEEMSFLEKAFLNLNGVQAKSKEELEELGLRYKEFNGNISDGFKSKVEEMTKDIHEFNLSLRDMRLDGILSDDEVSNVLNRVNDMMSGIKNKISDNNSQIQEALKNAYLSDDVISSSEQKLLDYWQNRTDLEVKEAENLQNKIAEIINLAKSENRELTADEENQIKNYYAQLKQLELKLQADNSYELEYAKSQFNQRIKTLDVEAAKELLQERFKQYEEEKTNTNAHYDALIAQVAKGKTALTEKEKETIKVLNEERETELNKNKEYWDEAYNYAISTNENLKGAISYFTGEELKQVDQKYHDLLLNAEQYYGDLSHITETGYYEFFDETNNAWQKVYAVVDETTHELKGIFDINNGNISAMTKEGAKDIKKLANDWNESTNNILSNNITMQGTYIDTKNQIRNASNEIIGKLENVVDASGKVKETIVDVNGEPIKIKSNTEEIIQDLKKTRNEMDSIHGKVVNFKISDGGSLATFKNNVLNTLGSLGGARNYAIGTSNAPEGIHTINEKGWELVDAPAGKTALNLGDNIEGDSAYLPQGTKVRSNLASTEMMIQSVKNEVSKQINKIDMNNGYYQSNTAQSTNFRTSSTNTSSNNSNNELLKTMNAMVTLLSDLVNKDTNIYMDSKKVGKLVADTVDNQISRKVKARM